MAVKGVGGGGRKGGSSGARGGGGVSGAGGAGGVGGVGKASGTGFAGRVDRAEGVAGPAAAGPTSALGQVDPVTAQAMDIARQLRSGQIKSKEEATKQLITEILKQKVRMQSKTLTQRIADTLQDDARLTQALERLWSKGADEGR